MVAEGFPNAEPYTEKCAIVLLRRSKNLEEIEPMEINIIDYADATLIDIQM